MELVTAVLQRVDVVMGPISWLRWQLETSKLVVIAVFLGLILGMVLAARGNRTAAVALLPLALLWVVCNGIVEGPVLLVINADHGITSADLLSFLAVTVSLSQLFHHARERQKAF